MTKKNIFVTLIVLLLAGLSLYLNRDRFASTPVTISHRSVPPRNPYYQYKVEPIVFLLNRELRLTSVKVYFASEIETNKYAHPIWDLVSNAKSSPLADFVYGATIPGMKPAVKGAMPDPLEPGINYRIKIEAGRSKAEHDFIPVARTQ